MLEPGGSNQTVTQEGLVMDFSGRGMRVQLPARVTPGTAVQLDFQNQILLGEVCYCQGMGQGYAIGIELEHSLSNLDDLSRLVRALVGETGPATMEPSRAA